MYAYYKQQWVNYKNHTDDFESTFRQGRAYIATYETETTATFKGVLNHETSFTFADVNSHDYNDNYANYYLVGNPFTFDINWEYMTLHNVYDGFAIVNSIDGTYDYDVAADISVGDGFFVMTTAEEPELSYNVTMDRKGREEKFSSVNVIASNGEGSDNVVISLAGDDKGGFVKLENINDMIADLYVREDNIAYGIFSYDEDVEEIPLYFAPKKMGNYSIRVETDGEFKKITILDKFTGEETDLLVENYTFTSSSSDAHDRFVLKIDNSQQADNSQQSTDNGHFAYVNNGDIVIFDIEGNAQIRIVDALGRCVYNGECSDEIHRVDAASHVPTSGVYVIEKIDDKGIKVQKMIL